MKPLKPLFFFILGFILAVALWQLEIVWIGHATKWGYSFGPFGDFNLPLWFWRDIWYSVIFIVFVVVFWVRRMFE